MFCFASGDEQKLVELSKKLTDYYGYEDVHMHSDLQKCAILLKYRTVYVTDIIEKNDCCVVRLEDVVTNPRRSIMRLMRYIGDDVAPEQLKFIEETSSITRDFTYSNYRIREQVLDLYKSFFTAYQIKRIEDIYFRWFWGGMYGSEIHL